MKQQLLSFLSSVWMPSIERIEDSSKTNCLAVEVYPERNFIPQVLLKALIKFADTNGYHYYVDVFDGDVRMRIYAPIEL